MTLHPKVEVQNKEGQCVSEKGLFLSFNCIET